MIDVAVVPVDITFTTWTGTNEPVGRPTNVTWSPAEVSIATSPPTPI
jgi:hypothetical protein